MVEGKYSVKVTKVPTGYDVYQDGKKIDSVKALFRAESEVKAENNAEEATAKKEEKGNKRVDIPSIIDNTTDGNSKKEEKENKDEKVIDGGTIVVDKKEKDNKDEKDNTKKPEKEDKKNNKKPAKPSKKEKAELPKAGAAAEAATIAAAAMATMGGAYLSLKKRK